MGEEREKKTQTKYILQKIYKSFQFFTYND